MDELVKKFGRQGIEMANAVREVLDLYSAEDNYEKVRECLDMSFGDGTRTGNVIETLKLYHNRRGNDIVINYLMYDASNQGFRAKLFKDSRINSIWQSYKDHDQLEEILDVIGQKSEGYASLDILDSLKDLNHPRVCEALNKFDKETNSLIIDFAHRYISEFTELLIDVFDRYDKCRSEIVDAFKECSVGRNINRWKDKMINDKAYEAITKSPDPKNTVKRILINDYEDMVNKIKDSEFREEIKYSDFEVVIKTFSCVREIHKNKRMSLYNRVTNGFYEELNRAISQSNTYRGKIRNLRQYCNEVNKKLKEFGMELMFENAEFN